MEKKKRNVEKWISDKENIIIGKNRIRKTREINKMCISDNVDKRVWIMVINIICKPVEKSKCEKSV